MDVCEPQSKGHLPVALTPVGAFFLSLGTATNMHRLQRDRDSMECVSWQPIRSF